MAISLSQNPRFPLGKRCHPLHRGKPLKSMDIFSISGMFHNAIGVIIAFLSIDDFPGDFGVGTLDHFDISFTIIKIASFRV